MIKNLFPATGLTGLHERQPHLVPAGEFPGYVTIEFSDGQKVDVSLSDTKNPQLIDLGGVIITDMFRLTIKNAYSGSEWPDLCVSEIMFVMGESNSPDTLHNPQQFSNVARQPRCRE